MRVYGFSSPMQNELIEETELSEDSPKRDYSDNLDKEVKILLEGNNMIAGVYRGINERGELIFMPTLIYDETTGERSLENERRSYISRRALIGMTPLAQEQLERMAEKKDKD